MIKYTVTVQAPTDPDGVNWGVKVQDEAGYVLGMWSNALVPAMTAIGKVIMAHAEDESQ